MYLCSNNTWDSVLANLGTTSPLYSKHIAIYFPSFGLHFTIWFPGSKHAVVICSTVTASWYAWTGEHDHLVKVIKRKDLPFLLTPLGRRSQEGSGSWLMSDRLVENICSAYLGYGTRLCWNSFRSTLRAPSNLREAVTEETICATILFRLVYVGRSTPKLFLQIS